MFDLVVERRKISGFLTGLDLKNSMCAVFMQYFLNISVPVISNKHVLLILLFY